MDWWTLIDSQPVETTRTGFQSRRAGFRVFIKTLRWHCVSSVNLKEFSIWRGVIYVSPSMWGINMFIANIMRAATVWFINGKWLQGSFSHDCYVNCYVQQFCFLKAYIFYPLMPVHRGISACIWYCLFYMTWYISGQMVFLGVDVLVLMHEWSCTVEQCFRAVSLCPRILPWSLKSESEEQMRRVLWSWEMGRPVSRGYECSCNTKFQLVGLSQSVETPKCLRTPD